MGERTPGAEAGRCALALFSLLLVAAMCGCAGNAMTAPAEAYLALGHVTPRANAEETEEESGGAVDIEARLEKWRERFRQNNRQLRALSWNCRVRYRVPGAYTLHLLYRAAADDNGDVQVWETTRRTEIIQGLNRAPDAPEPDDSGFDQAALMAALARAYTFPQPGLMERLLTGEHAFLAPGGMITAAKHDFVMPGDSVELALPPAPKEPVSMTFQSADPEAPAKGTVKWRALPDGTFYPATVELTLSDGGVVTVVENFGFRMQPSVAAGSGLAE
jgi:hypothetical protein